MLVQRYSSQKKEAAVHSIYRLTVVEMMRLSASLVFAAGLGVSAASDHCIGEFVDDGSGECVLAANGGDGASVPPLRAPLCLSACRLAQGNPVILHGR